jgi:hypothetical protein
VATSVIAVMTDRRARMVLPSVLPLLACSSRATLGAMHFRLVYPNSGNFWVPTMSAGVLVTPQHRVTVAEHVSA